MTPRAQELAITILRMIADGGLGGGAEGTFAKLNDIIEEIGDEEDVESIIDGFLLPMKYIRKINDKFKQVHDHELDYTAYQITESGKTHLSKKGATTIHQNNFGDVYGSNISVDSKYVSQIINSQDDKTKRLLQSLLVATEKKDKSAIIKTLGYIGDKSLDLLIAIIAGGVKL